MLDAILPLSRDEELSQVWRFANLPMFHRQNLLMHYFCCEALIQKLLPELQKGKFKKLFKQISLEEALNISKCHDDTELIGSDIDTHTKSLMTNYQKKFHNRTNKLAKIALSLRYGHEMGDKYLYYLSLSEKKECLTSQFVSFVDKTIGYGLETLHEILNENKSLTDNLVHLRYLGRIYNLKNKLNHLELFLKSEDPLNFSNSNILSESNSKILKTILNQKTKIKYNNEDIGNPTGIFIYDYCIEALLEKDKIKTKEILNEKGRETNPLTSNGIENHKIYVR